MKSPATHSLALVAGLALATVAHHVKAPKTPTPVTPTKEITATLAPYFSPQIPNESTPTPAICHEIGGAKHQILVQCYSFTSPQICQALVDAKKRGVDVRVIADKSDKTGKGELLADLVKGGVPVKIDAKHAIAHNKIMVIDAQTVISGSFNFTVSAEQHNAENCLIIKSPELATHYIMNWQAHDQHSEQYAP
jgi:phosphatidylserine/phosphatidylglycerophosphate/cardiolipin synthase-like enzyme